MTLQDRIADCIDKNWSDKRIARHVRVDESYVRTIKQRLACLSKGQAEAQP